MSISLAAEDVATLDRHILSAGVPSRSAAIQRAIQMLRDPELADAYAAAWDEWDGSGAATEWQKATTDGLAMLRCEIRCTDLDSARAIEANKGRPAAIVSNYRANASAAKPGREVVAIVPITSNVEQVCPVQVLLTAQETGLRVDSKAQGEQLRSVPVERLGKAIGPGLGAPNGPARRRPAPACSAINALAPTITDELDSRLHLRLGSISAAQTFSNADRGSHCPRQSIARTQREGNGPKLRLRPR